MEQIEPEFYKAQAEKLLKYISGAEPTIPIAAEQSIYLGFVDSGKVSPAKHYLESKIREGSN